MTFYFSGISWGPVVGGISIISYKVKDKWIWTLDPSTTKERVTVHCGTFGIWQAPYSPFEYVVSVHYFSSVQSLSCVRLFVTPRTAAHQASLSITNSQILLKLMSIESVMPFNPLLSSPAPPAFKLSQHQGLFK